MTWSQDPCSPVRDVCRLPYQLAGSLPPMVGPYSRACWQYLTLQLPETSRKTETASTSAHCFRTRRLRYGQIGPRRKLITEAT
jgi:hypothetical protein